MRVVGRRVETPITASPSVQGLIELDRLNATAVALTGGRCALPKGVFRFKSHEAANEWQAQALADLMGELARSRARA